MGDKSENKLKSVVMKVETFFFYFHCRMKAEVGIPGKHKCGFKLVEKLDVENKDEGAGME